MLEWKADDEIPIERSDTAVYVPPDRRKAAGSQPVLDLPPAGTLPTIKVDPDGGVERFQAIQRRTRQRRNRMLVGLAAFAGLLTGGYYLVRPHLPTSVPADEAVATTLTPATNSATPIDSTDEIPVSSPTGTASPTDGEPITLRMVPSGARLIVNLRPAQLWSDDPQMVELRASLTQDVTGWIESQLRSICRHEPGQIEEVLLVWILGSRGTEPELAAVVHLVEDARMSDLLDQFGSDAIDELDQTKVYAKGDTATLILDTKTFAVAPLEYGAELAEWVDVPNQNTSDGIIDLLQRSDRQRLVTVIFEPADLNRHLEHLVGDAARPVMSRMAEWFAADAETVGWSLHIEDEFYSELLVRGPRTTSTSTTETHLKERMEALPPQMVELIRGMRPQRSGFRRLIGRFPAMLEVSRQATVSTLEETVVKLVTVMPPKAAPNLALGTVLTWDEWMRTGSTPPEEAMAAVESVPKDATVTERLQQPVDAEFNRVPLFEALDYIGGEISVGIEIDGDALKDAGFTKNMAQTFDLGKVPAADALAHIVGQYNEPGKQIVVVIDEQRKSLLVTTRKFADQDGLTVHDFGS